MPLDCRLCRGRAAAPSVALMAATAHKRAGGGVEEEGELGQRIGDGVSIVDKRQG